LMVSIGNWQGYMAYARLGRKETPLPARVTN